MSGRTDALRVGEKSPAACLNEAIDAGIRVFGRVRDLRRVDSGRDAGINLAERSHEFRDVRVFRPVRGREDGLNFRLITFRSRKEAVGKDATQDVLVLVMVCVDESRHDDRV